jgi:phage-related protein
VKIAIAFPLVRVQAVVVCVVLALMVGRAVAEDSFFYPYRGIAMTSFVVRPGWIVSYLWTADDGVAELRVVSPETEVVLNPDGHVTVRLGSRTLAANVATAPDDDLEFVEDQAPRPDDTKLVGPRCGPEGLFPSELIERSGELATSTCWMVDMWTPDVVLSDLMVSKSEQVIHYARDLVRPPSPPYSRMADFLERRAPGVRGRFDVLRQYPLILWSALPETVGRWTLDFIALPRGALRMEARMNGLMSGASVEFDRLGRPSLIENWAFGLADGTWVAFDWDHATHWRALFRFGQRITERVGKLVVRPLGNPDPSGLRR